MVGGNSYAHHYLLGCKRRQRKNSAGECSWSSVPYPPLIMIAPMLPTRSPRSRAMSSREQFVSHWRAMLDLVCAQPGQYLAYRVFDHFKADTAKVERFN